MDCLKKQLRRQLQEKRRQLSAHAQEVSAKRVANKLFQQSFFNQAQHIALYLAFGGELPTNFILEKALSLHKFCYLPMLVSHHMQFVRVEANVTFVKNRYGILEPPPGKIIEPAILDVVLLPLVAFDRCCHRLGMGGGFYDRTFAFKRPNSMPRLVGLAYDFQHVEKIPRSNLDVVLDEVITDKKIYRSS